MAINHTEKKPFQFKVLVDKEKPEIVYQAKYRNEKTIRAVWEEDGETNEVFYAPEEVDALLANGYWTIVEETPYAS